MNKTYVVKPLAGLCPSIVAFDLTFAVFAKENGLTSATVICFTQDAAQTVRTALEEHDERTTKQRGKRSN